MLYSQARKADTRLHICTFSQERFVGADLGPNCLQMLSADDTSTDDSGYKWAMKKDICSLSSRVAKAYERSLAIILTAIK